MNVYDGAELSDNGARFWLLMDGWTLDETAFLLNAIDPKVLGTWTQGNGGKLELHFPAQFDVVKELLLRANETGALCFPATPAAVIAWAMGKCMKLPAPLIPADMVVKGGKWVKLETPPAQGAETPAPEVMPATEQTKPLQRGTAQNNAILDAIRAAGHDPQQLPKNAPGKPGVKKQIEQNLRGKNPVFPKEGKQFEKAWERLRNQGDIADKA